LPRNSPNGGSPNRNPLGGPPPNPHAELYKWPTPNPRMFLPPWYPLVAIRSKPTNKLPYQKL